MGSKALLLGSAQPTLWGEALPGPQCTLAETLQESWDTHMYSRPQRFLDPQGQHGWEWPPRQLCSDMRLRRTAASD